MPPLGLVESVQGLAGEPDLAWGCSDEEVQIAGEASIESQSETSGSWSCNRSDEERENMVMNGSHARENGSKGGNATCWTHENLQ